MATRNEEGTAFGMKTYLNYADAFCLYPETWEDLEKAQDALPDFRKIQRNASFTRILKRHLHRGFMTVRHMDMIPVDEMRELGMVSALWIPVQAYYAVHGFGLATLSTLDNDDLPETHAGFLSASEKKLVCKLLPDPFFARLKGGFIRLNGGFDRGEFMDFKLLGLDIAREPKRWPSNLSRPNPRTRIRHIARCLSTTRENRLKDRIKKQRRKCKVGKLPSAKKRRIANRLWNTTAFDYLYRIRLHSNYDNPELFALGAEQPISLEFVENNRKMAKRLCRLLLRIIERRLKKDDYTKLVNDCQSGVKWDA